MSKTPKLFAAGILGLFLLSMFGGIALASAVDTPAPETNVDGDSYAGNVEANVQKQYKFKNRFQFRLRTNTSMNLSADCDVDGVGAREFEMDVNTTANQELTLQVKASDEELGLGDGKQVKSQKKNQYQFREQFMINVSLNGTDTVKAQLRLKTEDKDATWAYYDEATGEWVEVESKHEDGMLIADTEHFSVWTVLSVEEPEEDTIDGYGVFAAISGLATLGIIFLKRRH